ncbi:MAG TPA: hypothetical protein PK675_00555 [Clostridia bacterium]|nr:hypothetical protein [Clostridia bacterium]
MTQNVSRGTTLKYSIKAECLVTSKAYDFSYGIWRCIKEKQTKRLAI